MNYSDVIEKKIKEKKLTKNNYTTEEPKNHQEKAEKKKIVTHLQKRGDYKDWEENWLISDNPILEELNELGYQLWINKKGEYVLRDVDKQEESVITPSNINRKISSLLGEKVFIGTWKDAENKVTPAEIISITSSEYRPDFKKRFFYIQKRNRKKYYLNTFTPTEYMNYTNKPQKEPKTILKLLSHLVNYKEDRLHYFLNWLAYYWATFKKPQTAIVLKGIQGAGKGTFADEIITPLFGKNQTSIMTNDILASRFKAAKFMNKSFYIFEETSKGNVKSNKDVKEFIKQIITNEIVPMEEKRISTIDVKVTAPSIFFTNEVKFLEIEPSDRRFSVFTTGDKIEKLNFLGFYSYEALAIQIKEELADFARYLYNFDIDVDLANTPMDTPEKSAVIGLTTNNYQKFLIALKNKDLEFFDVLLESEDIDKQLIYSQLENAFKEGKIKRALITKAFNATFDKDIPPQKLLEELKGIDIEFITNTIKPKNTVYILLP
jgi:hypothetical protein